MLSIKSTIKSYEQRPETNFYFFNGGEKDFHIVKDSKHNLYDLDSL